jgi:RNA polymerase sigma-70 factor (ECF subfamily)
MAPQSGIERFEVGVETVAAEAHVPYTVGRRVFRSATKGIPRSVRDADFERLVRRHANGIHAFLLYRTGDPDLAEEALADCFERAYRARHSFDRRRASEKTWLYTIALNRARDLARRAASEREAIRALGERQLRVAAVDPVAAADDRATLLAALDGLPPDEREAIALVYGADLTARAAARLLDVPATTIQGRVYRGLRRLREALDEPEGGR